MINKDPPQTVTIVTLSLYHYTHLDFTLAERHTRSRKHTRAPDVTTEPHHLTDTQMYPEPNHSQNKIVIILSLI